MKNILIAILLFIISSVSCFAQVDALDQFMNLGKTINFALITNLQMQTLLGFSVNMDIMQKDYAYNKLMKNVWTYFWLNMLIPSLGSFLENDTTDGFITLACFATAIIGIYLSTHYFPNTVWVPITGGIGLLSFCVTIYTNGIAPFVYTGNWNANLKKALGY